MSKAMKEAMAPISDAWRRVRYAVASLAYDCRGVAAIEFVFIVPLMLVLFFGMVEFSGGVSVYRKTTLVARTLSDLTSQSNTLADADLTNFFYAAYAIFQPYSSAPGFQPTTLKITELYVDPLTLQVRVEWSKFAQMTSSGSVANVTATPGYTVGVPPPGVIIPPQLIVPGAYMIFSEVSQLYVPPADFGGLMSASGVTLKDVAYTRPRQSTCVLYASTTAPALTTPCPVN